MSISLVMPCRGSSIPLGKGTVPQAGSSRYTIPPNDIDQHLRVELATGSSPSPMSSSSTSRPKRTQSSSRKSARAGGRPNRAQIRAAEARTAIQPSPASVVTAGQMGASQPGIHGRRPVAKVFTLSRAAELNYIRNDLRRLLYTSGILFVLMIVLLFIID